MASIREKDYIHSNERGNGPKVRMAGGDQTDDISINDPNNPFKKKPKKAEPKPPELVYRKPK
jgi:hypothetical protein